MHCSVSKMVDAREHHEHHSCMSDARGADVLCELTRADKCEKILAGGILAGVTTVTVVNPIWVIKTRLQLQGIQSGGGAGGAAVAGCVGQVAYQGSFDALRMILREEVRDGMSHTHERDI